MITIKKIKSKDTFKSMWSNYHVSDGTHITQLDIRKSGKLLCADIADFYFECNSMDELKEKIVSNWDAMEKFEM